MRKLGPAFILTTLVALASSPAFALGDKNKNKDAPRADATATQGMAANNKEACKNLAPNDPAWQQNKCGDTTETRTQKGGSGASAGEGGGSGAAGSAGGSGAAGSSGAGK